MTPATYLRLQSKLLRGLADHCHDKALEAETPQRAAQWIILMDHCLWAATSEGACDVMEAFAKEPA